MHERSHVGHVSVMYFSLRIRFRGINDDGDRYSEFTCYEMKFIFQGKHHSWNFRGEADAFRNAYGSRYILLLLWPNCRLEICNLSFLTCTYTHLCFAKIHTDFSFVILIIPAQESAHEKCQKYKEGKFVLERYISLLHIQIPIFFLWALHPT